MPALEHKAAFKAKVAEWAGKLGVSVAGVYVRPMRTKWASCSSNGILSFNAELLELEPQVWNYVIVHELLHFDVPNHGKLWKSLMRAHVGDWERCEELLRKHTSRKGVRTTSGGSTGIG
jgi:predicted metal-dependent hydrolase